MMRKRGGARRRAFVGLAVAGAFALGTAGPALATVGNPPGNNGTIKISSDGENPDPDNEPHVSCPFFVHFYGFDEGDLHAKATFEAMPPTAPEKGSPPLLVVDDIFIGEDDDSGGGSEEGLDAVIEVDLSDALKDIEPHPKQGWHVKVTVNAEGSQGADTKHKVFWVDECDPKDPGEEPEPEPDPDPAEDPDEDPDPTIPDEDPDPTVPGEDPDPTVPGEDPDPTVPGEGSTTTVVPAGDVVTTTTGKPGGSLPVTGSTALPLVAGGAALIAAGAGLVAGTKRLRRN